MTVLGEIRGGVYARRLPAERPARRPVLDSLQGSDINAVLVDLKDANGVVHYQSSLEQVAANGAQSEQAVDAAWLVKSSRTGAIPHLPGVRFPRQDRPRSMADSAVKYQGTQTNWIDKFPAERGKPWLNPL